MRGLSVVLSLLVCSAAFAQAAAPAGQTPVVVKTSPMALANDVDPATDKITVTFDRPMQDRSWSWTGGGETYPQITGKMSYDVSKTTCTLPVKLEPGKTYWVGVNSPSHQNFKSAQGVPARRYVVLFATRSADGKPTDIPQELRKNATQINGRALTTAPASPDQQAARDAAEDWLQLVDVGQYPEMWQALDPLAQNMVDQRTFTAQVSTVRDAMGKLSQRTFDSADHRDSLPGLPDGNYFILQYKSSFENKKQAIETVVMAQRDGQWKVSGYFIK